MFGVFCDLGTCGIVNGLLLWVICICFGFVFTVYFGGLVVGFVGFACGFAWVLGSFCLGWVDF